MELASRTQVLEGRGIYRDILKFRDLEVAFPGVVKRYTVFSTADTMLFHHNTRKTGNSGVEMTQAYFHDFAQSSNVSQIDTCLNMHSMSFQNWEMEWMLYKIILLDGAYLLLAVMMEGDESGWLRMAN